MNASYSWPALVTLLNIVLLMWVSAMVGRARGRYGIKAPATTGDPHFERAFRVQMNTVENTVIFLPALWLAALYAGGALVAFAGLLWIAGRIVYALAYLKDPARRGAGFGIAAVAFFVLLGDAAFGLVRALLSP